MAAKRKPPGRKLKRGENRHRSVGKKHMAARFGSASAAKLWGQFLGSLCGGHTTKATRAKAQQIRKERGIKRAIGYLRGLKRKANS